MPSGLQDHQRKVVALRSAADVALEHFEDRVDDYFGLLVAQVFHELQNRPFTETFTGPVARIADSIREEDEQIALWIPGAADGRGTSFSHTQRWIGGRESLVRAIGAEDESVRMSGVGVPDLAGVPVD